MIVETPDPARYGAAVLAGTIGGTRRLGVVMKASYDVVPDGTGPRRMEPVADRSRSAIRMADSINGAVTYEADVALAKARADIVVEGFLAGNRLGTIRIGGANWLQRTANPTPGDPDANGNLFGFEPRGGDTRKALAGNAAQFSVYHRRGGVFSDAGSGTELPSGGLVEVFQNTSTAGDPDYAVRLPDTTHGLRLRVYCGDGPDEAPRWRIAPMGGLSPDTLILRPETNTADILWRMAWDADLEPLDRYRKVQIREGGF